MTDIAKSTIASIEELIEHTKRVDTHVRCLSDLHRTEVLADVLLAMVDDLYDLRRDVECIIKEEGL